MAIQFFCMYMSWISGACTGRMLYCNNNDNSVLEMALLYWKTECNACG